MKTQTNSTQLKPNQTKPSAFLKQLVSQAISLPEVLELVADRRIKKALSLIHAESHRDWRYEDFAEGSRLTVGHFSRVFIECVGVGLPHYLRELRLMLALPFIDAAQLTLHEIALEVGMPNELALRRAFVDKYGFCPSEYHHNMPEFVASNGNCL